MTCKLHASLEALLTKRTDVVFGSAVSGEMMIVDGLTLEAFVAVFECAHEWTFFAVNRALVERETICDAERFAAELK